MALPEWLVDEQTEAPAEIWSEDSPGDEFLVDQSVEICSETSGEEALEPILRAHEAGKTVFYGTLDTFL